VKACIDEPLRALVRRLSSFGHLAMLVLIEAMPPNPFLPPWQVQLTLQQVLPVEFGQLRPQSLTNLALVPTFWLVVFNSKQDVYDP